MKSPTLPNENSLLSVQLIRFTNQQPSSSFCWQFIYKCAKLTLSCLSSFVHVSLMFFPPGWSLSEAPRAVKSLWADPLWLWTRCELVLHQRSLHHWGMLSCSSKNSASDVLSGDPFKWIEIFTWFSALKGKINKYIKLDHFYHSSQWHKKTSFRETRMEVTLFLWASVI